MTKLIAFSSCLGFCGAARIEFDIRNHNTKNAEITGQCILKATLPDYMHSYLSPSGDPLRLPVNSCQPSPPGAGPGSLMARPYPDFRSDHSGDCFLNKETDHDVCSASDCTVFIEYYPDASCEGLSNGSIDATVGRDGDVIGEFEEETREEDQIQQPPRCHVGDHVVCSDGLSQCSGNQCCPDGSACPSADDDFRGCALGKTLDCTHQQTPGCEACSGLESDCCVETNRYSPEITALRCINPAIDVCHDGLVCPLSKPSLCWQYTYSSGSGEATCFNPETHACVKPDNSRSPFPAHQVCPVQSVVCGGHCWEVNSGVCCGATWYRGEERKQCCQGSCAGAGCQTWACEADQECMRPFENGYSVDKLSRNCKAPSIPSTTSS